MKSTKRCEISVGGKAYISDDTARLRDVWEATSFELEKLQCAEECVAEEQMGLASRTNPKWELTFTPEFTPTALLNATNKVINLLQMFCAEGDHK